MKFLLGLICVFIALLGGAYIFVWWGVIQPILTVAQMIDTHTVTATAVAWELIKFLGRGIVTLGWAGFWLFVGGIFMIDS